MSLLLCTACLSVVTSLYPHTSVPLFLCTPYLSAVLCDRQFCTNYETSDKRLFPTFARTRPPDTQVSKSVLSLLLRYNWMKVAFFYKDSAGEQMH